MNSKTSNSNKSVIKLLYMLLIASSLVYATAWAETTPFNPNQCFEVREKAEAKCAQYKDKDEAKFEACISRMTPAVCSSSGSDDKDLKVACRENLKKINEGTETLQKVCGRLDLDSETGAAKTNKNCHTKLSKCMGDASDAMGGGGVVAALAALTGQPRTQVEQNCFESKHSYRAEKEKAENALEKQSEKVKSEMKAIAEIDKDVDKQYKSMSEKMKENQKEYDKLVKDNESEAAKAEEDALSAEIKAGETLRSINSAKAKARKDLDDAMYNADMALVKNSRELVQIECLERAEKAVVAYKQNNKTPRANMDALTSANTSLQSRADAIWRGCINEFEKQREIIARSVSDAQASYHRTMDDLDARETAANKIMKQQTEARALRLQNMELGRQKALKDAIQNNQMTAAELQSVQKNAMTEKMASQQRLMQAQAAANAQIARLSSLGPEPSKIATDDKSLKDLADKIPVLQAEARNFSVGECCTKMAASQMTPEQCTRARSITTIDASFGGDR
jgi:gas vesicle protein